MAVQQIDQEELVKALNYLKEIYPRTKIRRKDKIEFREFPPGTSEDALICLALIGKADQMVHQAYLPTHLQHQVSVVRNLYASK